MNRGLSTCLSSDTIHAMLDRLNTLYSCYNNSESNATEAIDGFSWFSLEAPFLSRKRKRLVASMNPQR